MLNNLIFTGTVTLLLCLLRTKQLCGKTLCVTTLLSRRPTVSPVFSLAAWPNSMTSTDTVNCTWIISLALTLSPLPQCAQQQFVTATCWVSQGFSVRGQNAPTEGREGGRGVKCWLGSPATRVHPKSVTELQWCIRWLPEKVENGFTRPVGGHSGW